MASDRIDQRHQKLSLSAPTTTQYLIRLNPPLDIPSEIQEVANLPKTPGLTSLEATSNISDPDINEAADDNSGKWRFVRISHGAKEAILEWSSRYKAIYTPHITSITVLPSNAKPSTDEQDAPPRWCFLHGALTQPSVIARILGATVEDLPPLHPARIARHALKQCRPCEASAGAASRSPSGPLRTDAERTRFRPAHAVLNRLRWDPAFGSGDYSVAYMDRFEGPREIEVRAWKSETTDEEFIPQHHIVRFQRKVDGLVLWDRDRG